MNNNLYNVEKNLRSIAKRYENVKYSVGLAVLFLMKGTSAFSDDNMIQETEKQKDILIDVKKGKSQLKEKKTITQKTQKLKASWTSMQFGANDLYSNFFATPKTDIEKTTIVKNEKTVLVASADNSASLPMFAKLSSDIEKTSTPTTEEINTSKENLRNSVGNLQNKIDIARKENSKEIEGLKLELVQLMEQGNQVVKSPWSSWQFGANYFYDNWGSAYKGRGDKKAEIYNLQRDNTMKRFVYPTSGASSSSVKYGLTDLSIEEEEKSKIIVNAAIRPKLIDKEPPKLQLPTVTAPNSRALGLTLSSPKAIQISSVKAPDMDISIVNPNASPFSDFFWGWLEGVSIAAAHINDESRPVWKEARRPMMQNIDITGGVFWSGVKPDGTAFEGSGFSGASQDTTVHNAVNFTSSKNYDKRHQTIINSYDGRWSGRPGNKITGGSYYVRGRDNTPTAQGVGFVSGKGTGTAAFHIVGDVEIKNVTVNLYNRAAFINAEAFRGGSVKMENVTINILEDSNTVFNIQGKGDGAYQDSKYFSGGKFSTSLTGDANIRVGTKDNTIYAMKNYAGGLRIENKGEIIFDGASNIGFSVLTWVPDKSKYIAVEYPTYTNGGNQGEGSLDKYIPYIKLSADKPMKFYGDENVGIFFNTKNDNIAHNKGIHQGYFELYFDIGSKLDFDSSAVQKEAGRLNKVGYTSTTVDGNVGVYAISGQRQGVDYNSLAKSSVRYNVTDTATTKPYLNFLEKDPIHNLNFDKFNITFGKYAKNGFMFLAKNGTVIDIQAGAQSDFSDGINGTNTLEADTGAKTIIAYAEGKWTANGTGLTELTGTDLENKPTEIIVDKKLHMVSKEGVAFFAKDGGKITVKKDAEARGYKSVLAYAEAGTVDISSNIKAQDENVITLSEKYQNIGAYTKNGGTITVGGNATINGLAALADGVNAKVYLNGTDNIVNTGTGGGLFATNGGIVEFNGGTIVNKDNSLARGLSQNDHDAVTPFHVENSGKIIFKNGATTNIEMYDGILVSGEDSDYTIGTGGTNKYQGMSNVKVKLMKDGVNLGIFKNLDLTWAGNSGLTTFTNGLLAIPKFGALNTNGKSFKTTLVEGKLTVNSNVNLADNSDQFNGILMERELVTINSGKTITGNGKGLSMGSNSGAASNAESGYINKGTVNITGGTTSSGIAGINVSYGQILNDTTGIVEIDNGAGLYGTNGSKIVNKGTVTVTGSGTGIAGLGKGNTTPAITYGDGKIQIENHGTINISGANSTGIYAENNKGAAQSDVIITNTKSLSLGDNSVGIALKSVSGVGGEINISGTGNSDIKVGTNGFGIYAEDSKLILDTNYGIETGDNGVGIYTKGSSTVGNAKTLNYKYSGSRTGSGIATLYSGSNVTNNLNINLNNSTNTIAGMVGVFANGGGNFTNTGDITGKSNAVEFGIVADNNTNVINSGNITLGNASTLAKGNVGIYVKTANNITNTGSISVGDNSIALYGYGINHTNGNISVGNNGIGIFSQGGNVLLTAGTLTVSTNKAVGVFTSGANQTIASTNSMVIGDASYGFVIKGTGHNLTTNNGTVTLGNDSVFAYSDKTGTMTNRTQLLSTGSGNYGLYSAGNIKNLADINFASGVGNVGIYSTGGTAVNGDIGLGIRPRIIVNGTDSTNKLYGIGMAAGYYDEENKILKNTGNIVNYGTIDVLKSESIGMYAVGNGSTAKNYGTINLSGKNTVGMYLDQGAIGENYGTIKSVPNATNDGIKGVVALNGSIFKNYGQVTIDSPNATGYYYVNTQNYENKGGTITVSGDNAKETDTASQNDTTKRAKGIEIEVKIDPSGGSSTATVIRNGTAVKPIAIDTNIASPSAKKLTVGDTTLDLSSRLSSIPNMSRGSEIGMYVDTSGINYTNPIQGLDKLTNLKAVNLIFGTEASEYTTEKDIEIGPNILNPYNDVIRDVSSAGGGKVEFLMNSSNLTWIATATQNADLTIAKLYLSKRPYTTFAKEKDTYNFMDGLEQRYGVEKEGTRERELFKKINKLGLNEIEQKLFVQAVDEMKGHQYANVQQRIVATGDILDKEFNYLRNEWSNPTKDSNKIKTFGVKGEYNTNTAGVIDYTNNAYGVAYVHEDETVRLGESVGWYAGIVHNTFKFKDFGNSKEEQLQAKVGLFKSVPFDENNSLNWRISGDVFAGYNKMNRKFLVVDEVFGSKGRYHTYGLGLKNEISKEFRLSESFTFKPYAALGLEYGRVSKISEKSGEMKLEVKANDYFSIKPEIGTELAYKHYFGANTMKVGVSVAYENELGRVANGKNKAKVAGTNADWYDLRGEKEDRTGNIKTDLNIDWDNQRVGVTASVGYDTKGHNVRAGVGLRVIF